MSIRRVVWVGFSFKLFCSSALFSSKLSNLLKSSVSGFLNRNLTDNSLCFVRVLVQLLPVPKRTFYGKKTGEKNNDVNDAFS